MLAKGSGRKGKNQRGGFISYAQLGINQLGAVYEGLMSYTGFIAAEELYEVAKKGDPSGGSWMIPASKVPCYADDVFVMEKDENGFPTGERVRYRPGSFVYRLAGRDRQTSASYYTPQSLTSVTVQLALEQRIKEEGRPVTAAEVLRWRVCEPALGSGAFLNEAIDQLAALYLRLREEETGDRLEPDQRALALQKVKAYIALHNCYGVDLNETAVELAEVSIWLNVMHRGLQAPWFGLHLVRGNSLIGAGRRLYPPEQLAKAQWLKSAPEDVPFSAGQIPVRARPPFPAPRRGLGRVAGEKEAKELAPEDTKRLADWRKGIRKPRRQEVSGQKVARSSACRPWLAAPSTCGPWSSSACASPNARSAAPSTSGALTDLPGAHGGHPPRQDRLADLRVAGHPVLAAEDCDGRLVRPLVLAGRQGRACWTAPTGFTVRARLTRRRAGSRIPSRSTRILAFPQVWERTPSSATTAKQLTLVAGAPRKTARGSPRSLTAAAQVALKDL